MQFMGTKHYPVLMFSDGMDDFMMDEKTLKDTLRKTVVEDLRKRKIFSCFFPHNLTPEQKDRRTAACRDLIATADSDPDFFKKIVTDDETWCFAYDPTTKRQSAP